MGPFYLWGQLRLTKVNSGPESPVDQKWEMTVEEARLPAEEMTGPPRGGAFGWAEPATRGSLR